MRRLGWLGAALIIVLLAPATADRPTAYDVPGPESETLPPAPECRIIDLEMQPASGMQIVAWIEDTAGTFVDTVYITQATGTFGLGNRAGVFGMKSGPKWPYGPRPDVFPVWSHRHGIQWKQVRFQNGDGDPGGPLDCFPGDVDADLACKRDPDRNLSHMAGESSAELHYTRPLLPTEPAWDIGTAASAAFTDKGTMQPVMIDPDGDGTFEPGPQRYSLYPPRDDLQFDPARDADDVLDYDGENPFDVISQATPIGGQPYRYSWLIPPELYTGVAVDYVMFVEVSKEFDPNATYNSTSLPAAVALGWNQYGLPYRGQPSVVYRVPFQIGPEPSHELTAEIAGYGDPGAGDGVIRSIDGTMTMDALGSGALRLERVHDPVNGEDYQVRIDARFETDEVAPDGVGPLAVVQVDTSGGRIELTAPGDDGMGGHAAGLDVRYLLGEPVTYENFGSAPRVVPIPQPEAAGVKQTVDVRGLIPSSTYFIAVRAYDSCRNYGPISVIELTTDDRTGGAVDACFVATAAYGSLMANDVQMLRTFRDVALRSNVIGELAVETYYTFGPALAWIIGDSELLRATARTALEPVVDRVRPVME